MNLLIVGGSLNHLGGVEAFSDRAKQALEDTGNYSVRRIPSNTAYLSFWRIPYLLSGWWSLIRQRALRTDCVWLQYVNLPDMTYLLLAKLLGFTVIVTPHLGSNWRSQTNPVLGAISLWILGLADRIALISKTQEQEIFLPKKVPWSYIRNFLPATIWESGLPPERDANDMELRLVHAGRLSEGKGTFLFVDVCKSLQELGVRFSAKIAGGTDKETFSRLAHMIESYGLQDHVKVLGRVSDEELFQLLRDSDALVHLSKIDSYPLIVLECIAYCTFPICMDLAGARDMVTTYTGLIVTEAGAVSETADFLKKEAVANIRAASRRAALHVRDDYKWSNCVRALDAALSATVARRTTNHSTVSSR